jgi:hypothetical protein
LEVSLTGSTCGTEDAGDTLEDGLLTAVGAALCGLQEGGEDLLEDVAREFPVGVRLEAGGIRAEAGAKAGLTV